MILSTFLSRAYKPYLFSQRDRWLLFSANTICFQLQAGLQGLDIKFDRIRCNGHDQFIPFDGLQFAQSEFQQSNAGDEKLQLFHRLHDYKMLWQYSSKSVSVKCKWKRFLHIFTGWLNGTVYLSEPYYVATIYLNKVDELVFEIDDLKFNLVVPKIASTAERVIHTIPMSGHTHFIYELGIAMAHKRSTSLLHRSAPHIPDSMSIKIALEKVQSSKLYHVYVLWKAYRTIRQALL